MNEDRGKYFTTGEFADLCNVKKKTLFYYDEIGLLSPEFRNEKGYRFYSFQQYGVFTVIELLKSLGMPLKEMKAFLEDKTPDELKNLLARKSKELEQKRAELNRIQKLIDTKVAQIELALATDFSKITIDDHEEIRLYLSPSILHCSDRTFVKVLSAFSKEIEQQNMNTGNPIGALISKEQLLENDYENYQYLYVEAESVSNKVPLFVRPAGMYITAYHIGSEETIWKTYDLIFSFLEKNHMRFEGFAYEEYILDEVAVNGIDEYVTRIQIKVEKVPAV